jgi:hypothetical protein
MFLWDKKTRAHKKISYIFVLIPWYPISYLTIAGDGFFLALTGPYLTLRFGQGPARLCDNIRGRHTGASRACQSANGRSPKKTLLAPPLSIRRVVATRPSPPPPKCRPWWWCGGGCRRGLCRRGGRDGGGVGGRRGRRRSNDAMAVPPGPRFRSTPDRGRPRRRHGADD